jgi:hypothetical protein
MRECDDCGTRLDEDDECERCNAERQAKMAEMRRGDWRAALKPAGPWASREDTMRAQDAEEDHRAGWGFHPETDPIARWFLRGAD